MVASLADAVASLTDDNTADVDISGAVSPIMNMSVMGADFVNKATEWK